MVRAIRRFVAILVAMFALAGRLSYWQAWAYGASGLLCGAVGAVLFAGKSDLIEERGRPGPGMKWWDKVFFALYIPTFLAILAVAALDAGRFHWTSPWPVLVYVGGYVVLVTSYVFVLWSMWFFPVSSAFRRTVASTWSRGCDLPGARESGRS